MTLKLFTFYYNLLSIDQILFSPFILPYFGQQYETANN